MDIAVFVLEMGQHRERAVRKSKYRREELRGSKLCTAFHRNLPLIIALMMRATHRKVTLSDNFTVLLRSSCGCRHCFIVRVNERDQSDLIRLMSVESRSRLTRRAESEGLPWIND